MWDWEISPLTTLGKRLFTRLVRHSLRATFVFAPGNDIASNKHGSSKPPERGKGLRKDDKAKDRGNKEVRRRVDDGDLSCRVASSESLGEQCPHLGSKSEQIPV